MANNQQEQENSDVNVNNKSTPPIELGSLLIFIDLLPNSNDVLFVAVLNSPLWFGKLAVSELI